MGHNGDVATSMRPTQGIHASCRAHTEMPLDQHHLAATVRLTMQCPDAPTTSTSATTTRARKGGGHRSAELFTLCRDSNSCVRTNASTHRYHHGTRPGNDFLIPPRQQQLPVQQCFGAPTPPNSARLGNPARTNRAPELPKGAPRQQQLQCNNASAPCTGGMQTLQHNGYKVGHPLRLQGPA